MSKKEFERAIKYLSKNGCNDISCIDCILYIGRDKTHPNCCALGDFKRLDCDD